MNKTTRRPALWLGNDYIFRTTGGAETDPTLGAVICATGVESRKLNRPGDLRSFFEECGAFGETLDRLIDFYLPTEPPSAKA